MSKPRTSLDSAVRVVFVILMGFIALVLTGELFMLIFVPIIVWYLWAARDKTIELEKRLAALEGPEAKKPE